ncbi:MAG TPA: hypothetical protein DHW34_00545 [Actinobacteria bacterium]|nr:hypothetical protein [Actinomycetota bacterium]
MATVLGSSAYAGDLLLRAPEATAMLGDDGELIPVDAAALLQEALVTVERQEDADEAALAIRALRRRELLRICIADVLGRIDDDTVMSAVTELSRAAVAAALAAAHRVVQSTSGEALPMRLTIIGMGRFGGGEMGYGSDADVVFVFEAGPSANDEAAAKAALAVANEVIALLGRPSADPPLVVDAGLRPEGRQGPLVRSLASYRAYYERWSLVWESQALLRATVVAGDADLGERFLDLIDPLRYPAGGLTAEQVTEIRRLKARMEAERLPRGADPRTHLKLGPGGLSDVEWVVQLLQLQHAHEVPALRTQGTLTALQAAVDANLVSSADARALADSWRAATEIRHAVVMARGVPADAIPVQPADRARVAHLLGYGASGSEQMVEDYLRKSRRARAVVERLFYG